MMKRRVRQLVAGVLVWALAVPSHATAAELTAETLQGWDRYVRYTESRIATELADGGRFLASDFLTEGRGDDQEEEKAGKIILRERETTAADGAAIEVNGGQVHHWLGDVFVPGITLDQVKGWLDRPDRHRQPDVLAARVIERTPGGMKVFLKITRSHAITVTYNTEHLVRIRQHRPDRLSSSSVAVRIAELDGAGTASEREKPAGEDHGFLWRLNSYWRYTAVDGGVMVECESLTLSRSAPPLLGSLISPLVDRIARESLTRTLSAVRADLAGTATPPASSWRPS